MKFLIGTQKDIASVNMINNLQSLGFNEIDEKKENFNVYKKDDFILLESDRELIYYDGLLDVIRKDFGTDVDYVVFLSKHASESGIPTLTTHVTGNLSDEAKYGGEPESLAIPLPNKMKLILENLKNKVSENNLDYEVSYEATHHGPTEIGVPLLFVEIGSSESRWKDKMAGKVIVESLLNSLNSNKTFKPVLGVGGGHYAPRHTDEAFERDIAYGHIIPEYMNPKEKVIKDAIMKTSKSLNEMIVHSNRTPKTLMEKVLNISDELGIKVKEL